MALADFASTRAPARRGAALQDPSAGCESRVPVVVPEIGRGDEHPVSLVDSQNVFWPWSAIKPLEGGTR